MAAISCKHSFGSRGGSWRNWPHWFLDEGAAMADHPPNRPLEKALSVAVLKLSMVQAAARCCMRLRSGFI